MAIMSESQTRIEYHEVKSFSLLKISLREREVNLVRMIVLAERN